MVSTLDMKDSVAALRKPPNCRNTSGTLLEVLKVFSKGRCGRMTMGQGLRLRDVTFNLTWETLHSACEQHIRSSKGSLNLKSSLWGNI